MVTVSDEVVLAGNLISEVLNVIKKDLKAGKLRSGLSPSAFFPASGGNAGTLYHVEIILTVSVCKTAHSKLACLYLGHVENTLGQLAECGGHDGNVKYLLEKGEASLKISLDTFKDILRDKNARAEVNLFSEHPEIGGVPTIGIIDHMSINEETKTIEVYDFKTGKYDKKKWGSVNTLYKYSLQLGMYKLMLESCPSFKKYKVTKGHILFVTPDDEGKVYDKDLDFDKDLDEKELIALCQAVYKQATTLAFLDDEELKVESDKSAGMPEIRRFIELLLAKTDIK